MVRVAALSDIGCRRSNNEDSFGYDEAAGLYVVSDGMGGSAAGEVASHLAVSVTLAQFREMLASENMRQSPMQHLLYYAILKANAAVFSQAQRDPRCTGMGATLVALCMHGQNAIIANVGDSRAYLLRGNTCTPITRDHSLGAEQILLHPETILQPNHPSFNIVTRAIGVESEVKPDLYAAQVVAGDRILLASDGLMKHLTDPEIGDIVRRSSSIQIACTALIDTVKKLGAQDNVTCLLVEA
ncbi:MAG: PP2C family protein-serine/threonine phosphatase [Janthinobacterium lividum]